MKHRIFTIIMAAALLTVAGCKEDTDGIMLGIEQEDIAGHKTVIDDTSTPRLTGDGSELMLVNGSVATVRESSGKIYLQVSESETGTYRCIYPANMVTSGLDIANMTAVPVEYESEQTYSTTTFGNGTTQVVEMPMAAYTEGKTLYMKNAAAIVRVNVSNKRITNLNVGRISVIGVDNSCLYNHGTVHMNGTGNAMAVTVELDNTATPVSSYSLNMEVGEATVASGETKSFDIVLPPTTANFKIAVLNTNGDTVGSKTVGSRTLQRNMIATVSVDAESDPPMALPYFNDFEDGTFGDLTLFDNDDNNGPYFGWNIVSRQEAPFGYSSPINCNGNYCIYSFSYVNGYGAYIADNWVILPRLSIPSEGATLQFHGGYGDTRYPDYIEIMITTGTTMADLMNGLFMQGIMNNSYPFTTALIEHWIDISQFAGQDVYIALRHNDYDYYYIALDDIRVFAGQQAKSSKDPSFTLTKRDNSVSIVREDFPTVVSKAIRKNK